MSILTKEHQEIKDSEGWPYLCGWMEGEISTLRHKNLQLTRKVDEQQKRILDLECQVDSLIDAAELVEA